MHKAGKCRDLLLHPWASRATELNLKSSPFKAAEVITRHQSSQFSDKLLCAKGIKRILKKLAQAVVVMVTDVHNISPLLIKITAEQGENTLLGLFQSFNWFGYDFDRFV